MALAHGGNVYEIASRLNCTPECILDYSASINPLGPPPGLLEEVGRIFERLQHYPDIRNAALIDALAEFHGLPASQIVVGNGSTELIYWLPRVLEISRAAVVLPTFSEYQKAFELHGLNLARLYAAPEAQFQPTVEQLDALVARNAPEAILFTNPGSPSGTVLPESVRRWIREKSATIYCLVDEVFVDFCEAESLKGFLSECPKLVLMRSMTKFYGIPGLRLGYLFASETLAERLRHYLPPWSVNTLAQMAGVHCLSQGAYRQETLEAVSAERERMRSWLESLPGCRVFPGQANYLLVELDESLPEAAHLQQALIEEERILIRDCTSFDGTGPRFFRVAVRGAEHNTRLLEGIGRWVRAPRRASGPRL